MKKKVLSVILAACMTAALAACGSSAASAGSASASGTESGDSVGTAASDGEIVDLDMQIVTFGQEFSGLADVEAALNEISEAEIGVHVTLDPVAAWDLPTTSSLAITSNEEMGVMLILPMGANMDSLSNYTTKNMLVELNDLYAQYGQDAAAVIGDLVKIGYVGENLYAVPANYYAGRGYSFVARTAALDELGYSFDEDTIYDLSDVEEVLAAYQEKYGNGYYAIAGFADADLVAQICPTDDLGDTAIGSLMNGGLDNTTVVNRFASDEYREAYDKVRDWYNAGYINPDVISITDTWTTLLQTGQYLGAFANTTGSGLDGLIVNEQSVGEDLTVIRYIDDFAITTSAAQGLWAIPVTCPYPEKAMQLINLMYANTDFANLLEEGIEGETYQVVETLSDGRLIIDYVDGVDRMTAPFEAQYPIYGDGLSKPQFVPVDEAMFDEIKNYNDGLEKSKAFGYVFDSTNFTNQITAINNVLQTYRAQLAWGTVDVDTVLPQFLSELEAAGINDVIAANQEQLDAWLAEQ